MQYVRCSLNSSTRSCMFCHAADCQDDEVSWCLHAGLTRRLLRRLPLVCPALSRALLWRAQSLPQ